MASIFDIEATNLLNNDSIDYTASPYRLKEDFNVHCAVFIDIQTKDIVTFDPKAIHKLPKYAKSIDHIIGHNIINYDLLALKLFYNMDYTVEPDSWCNKPCKIEDTLVISKTLNPDRWFGHSLDDWGKQLNYEKIKWRNVAIELGLIPEDAPKGAEFKVYHPKMLEYCVRDAEVNLKVYEALQEEQGNWEWDDALSLEHKTAEIITRQEHTGFYFHEELAKQHVKTLDKLMLDISTKVEPLIPPKKLTKAQEKLYKFPARCFLKTGGVSKDFEKFLKRTSAEVIYNDNKVITSVIWLGKAHNRKTLPLLVTEEEKKAFHPFTRDTIVDKIPATLKDGIHIKEWLVSLGWNPIAFKDKDLTVNSKKKKLNAEDFNKSAERYIEQTLASNFKIHRFEHLKVANEREFKLKILRHDLKKPLKVLTNPQFTIDQDKTICPNLALVEKIFPYTGDVVKWLTYNHRRNSILGGGVRFDDGEAAEKGFLSVNRIRVDSRIPTPADTMGAASGRFRHRSVANIPRSTSVFGSEMRSLFGCAPSKFQLGSDFVSVEAMIEGHYTIPYRNGKAYAAALTGSGDQSIHTLNAYVMGITRPDAKTLKYSCTYGAQPNKIAKQMGWTLSKARRVFKEFWEAASPLKELKEKLETYWETLGERKFILGLDGRKVPTRSKHSLLNNLFQSAGAITFKRQMIMFDKKLKEEGLLCDFFKDDWKNMVYVQQMLAYHN